MASGGWLGNTIKKAFGGGKDAADPTPAPTPAVAVGNLTAQQAGTVETGDTSATNPQKRRGKGSLYISSNNSGGGSGTGLNL